MTDADRGAFADMLAAVFTYYGKELPSESVILIYFEGLKAYDLPVIRQAMGMHAKNPDTGQFLPKIADVEKMVGGSTMDSALQALNKLEKAQSTAGAYRSVVFDDPLIHVVVNEMGGYVHLCTTATARDWEFRRLEFLNRYRSYRLRSQLPDYPAKMVGLADAENGQRGGERPEDTILIGNVAECQKVLKGGTANAARIGATSMASLIKKVVPQLEVK